MGHVTQDKLQIINAFVEFEKLINDLVMSLLEPSVADALAVHFNQNPGVDIHSSEIASDVASKIRSTLKPEAIEEDYDFFIALLNHVNLLKPIVEQIVNMINIISREPAAKNTLGDAYVSLIKNFASMYYISLCTIIALHEGDEGPEAQKVYEYAVERIKQLSGPWRIDKPCV